MCFLKHVILILNISYIKFGESTEVKSQLAKGRKRKEAHVSQRARPSATGLPGGLGHSPITLPRQACRPPHQQRGGGSQHQRKAKVSTASSHRWDTCTCGIHVVNFSHAVCLPQNLSAGQKAETSNQQEKNEWQPLSFNPSNSLLTATHVPGAQTREAGGRRKKTEGGRCSSTVRSRAVRAQLSPGNKPAGQHTGPLDPGWLRAQCRL